MKATPLLKPAVFGLSDGLMCVVGVILSLLGHQGIVFQTAVLLGAGEAASMAAGEWLSDSDAGWAASAAIGGATGVGSLLPAIPYAFLRGGEAVAGSVLALVAVVAVIAAIRARERGWARALAETYGVLLLVLAVVTAAYLLTGGAG